MTHFNGHFERNCGKANCLSKELLVIITVEINLSVNTRTITCICAHLTSVKGTLFLLSLQCIVNVFCFYALYKFPYLRSDIFEKYSNKQQTMNTILFQ